MTVRLRDRVSTRKPVGRNSTHNGNEANEAQVAKKKTATRKKTNAVVEEPVVMKVTRTVKKKYQDEAQGISHSTDQENPDQPKDEDEEIDLETIEVRRFLVEPARVNYHYNVGRNVHFQSVSVGCSVTIPCYKEEIPGALIEAKELVAARLKVELKKADGVVDYLVEKRIKADQELVQRGIR
jgi:hypothetical protein